MKTIDLTNDELAYNGILIHGTYNTGKTHIAGSALQYEKAYGPCTYLHVAGEPSIASLRAFDLGGVQLVTLESIDDFATFTKSLPRQRLIVLDSLSALDDLAEVKVTGGTNPVGKEADGRREWGQIKFHFNAALVRLFKVCDLLLAVAPSYRAQNDVTKQEYIAVELAGKNATRIAHKFAFVGYLEATTMGPTKVVRKLSFNLRTDALTRCNAPHPLTTPIVIPEGLDAWAPVKGALEGALKK